MSEAAALEILERYRRIEQVTGTLRDALETGDFDQLDALVSRRAALIAEVSALLEVGAGRDLGPRAGGQSPGDRRDAWDEVHEASRRAVGADAQLRALMVSHAHQIPASLAELRGGRDALRGYAEGTVPPDSVDRRG